jgi:hypothetical protein
VCERVDMQCVRSDFEKSQVTQPNEPDKNNEDIDHDLDLLPEYCHYRDEGCELALSCLDCPFPRCIYERSRGRTETLKSIRDAQIVRLHTRNKITIRELAITFRLSERTIARIIARGKASKVTARRKRENLK